MKRKSVLVSIGFLVASASLLIYSTYAWLSPVAINTGLHLQAGDLTLNFKSIIIYDGLGKPISGLDDKGQQLDPSIPNDSSYLTFSKEGEFSASNLIQKPFKNAIDENYHDHAFYIDFYFTNISSYNGYLTPNFIFDSNNSSFVSTSIIDGLPTTSTNSIPSNIFYTALNVSSFQTNTQFDINTQIDEINKVADDQKVYYFSSTTTKSYDQQVIRPNHHYHFLFKFDYDTYLFDDFIMDYPSLGYQQTYTFINKIKIELNLETKPTSVTFANLRKGDD